jgi:hypothetical protein
MHPLLCFWIVQNTKPHAHIDSVDSLSLIDCEASEAVMFFRLSFDCVLQE